MTAEEFQAFIHPLTYIDASKLLGVSERYIRMMVKGERPAKVIGVSRVEVIAFLRGSGQAFKSRQQLRNQLSYKEYIKLMGVGEYKCRVCCYPASQEIYKIALCECCVKKMIKTKEKKK